MNLQFLKTKEAFSLNSFDDGLIAIFTCDPNSKLATSQLENLENLESQLSQLKLKIIFVTDTNSESENENYFLNASRDVVNLSPKIKNQKKLGENLIVLIKSGNNIKHGDTKEDPEDSSNWIEALIQVAKNFEISEPDSEGYYMWGQVVPETAEYLCKDCGYVEEFQAGTIFPICEVCIAGEPTGPSGPSEGYWEKI